MKRYILILFAFYAGLWLQAANEENIVYTNASNLQLIGKATVEGDFFHRIDTAHYQNLPSTVKQLYTYSAGLAIAFKTNSSVIKVKWRVPNKKQNANMTPIMQKGLDLYIRKDGIWQYAGVGIPQGIDSSSILAENMDESEKECLSRIVFMKLIVLSHISSTEGLGIQSKIKESTSFIWDNI